MNFFMAQIMFISRLVSITMTAPATTTVASNSENATTTRSSILASLFPDCKHGRVGVGDSSDWKNFDWDNIYKCKCDSGWEGKLCDLPICENGGKRTDKKTCECVNGWVSDLCDKKPCDEYRYYSKKKAECLCKESGYEGERCHLPKCGTHGTRKLKADGDGYCECESNLWYGEFCKKSQCGKHGTPYQTDIENENNETESVVRCNCNTGYIVYNGKTKCKKDCHGHGRPMGFGYDVESILDLCSCERGWAMHSDCKTCSYGYSGSNCDRTRTNYGSSSSGNSNSNSNYNNNDNDWSSSDSGSSDSSNSGTIAAFVVFGILALVMSMVCALIKNSCRNSSPTTRTTLVTGGEGAYVTPVPVALRNPHPYRSTSPIDPRAPYPPASTTHHYGHTLSPGDNTGHNYGHQDTSSDGWRTYVGPSVPSLDERRNEAPPPDYSQVGMDAYLAPVEEQLPPKYEDAVKQLQA